MLQLSLKLSMLLVTSHPELPAGKLYIVSPCSNCLVCRTSMLPNALLFSANYMIFSASQKHLKLNKYAGEVLTYGGTAL
jgi:hypothetical protein